MSRLRVQASAAAVLLLHPARRKAARHPPKRRSAKNTRVAAGEYTVRSGETLMGIASRVRPAGLSTRQTMLALVQVNLEIFESGSPDRIWPGNVLNIPAAEELHRLAKPVSLCRLHRQSLCPRLRLPSRLPSPHQRLLVHRWRLLHPL